MRYVIAVFLEEPDSWVEELRQRFDPLAEPVPAHMTLVHPFDTRMTVDELRCHLEWATRGVRPFVLELQGVTGYQGEYLFLNVKRGNDDVIGLRQKLYQGALGDFRDPSETYLPHVTVGRLSSDGEFRQALREAQSFDERIRVTVEKVHAYTIEPDGRREVVTAVRLDR